MNIIVTLRITNSFITDFVLSLKIIPTMSWIERKGFRIRKILLLKWIFLGNFITMAYNSTLLSSLITIRYEDPIDSLTDLEASGLPFLMHKNSWIEKMFANDNRQLWKNIYNNGELYFNPRRAFKM